MKPSERLSAIGLALGQEVARIVASVRAWDRFVQMRLAVLAIWGALAILAIGIARSGSAEDASNPLHAYVALRKSPLGWALLVHNRSEEAWTEVAIELDGGQVHMRDAIGPDEKLVLSPWQFVDAEGEAARADPPRGVSLRVGERVIRPPLSKEEGD